MSKVNTADITITSLETITAFDAEDGSYLFTLDELQSASIAQSQETTPARTATFPAVCLPFRPAVILRIRRPRSCGQTI